MLQVQNTFQDFEELNILRPYMNDSIMEISKACQAFEADSAPSVAGNSILLFWISECLPISLTSHLLTNSNCYADASVWDYKSLHTKTLFMDENFNWRASERRIMDPGVCPWKKQVSLHNFFVAASFSFNLSFGNGPNQLVSVLF